MQEMGLCCPEDISVVGFGDEEWCELLTPPLTTIKQDVEGMAEAAVLKITDKIEKRKCSFGRIRIPAKLFIRKSTQMIGRGPFGEKAFSPDDITFTEEEKEKSERETLRLLFLFIMAARHGRRCMKTEYGKHWKNSGLR